MNPTTPLLETESNDEVLTVRLNRPDTQNALNRELLSGLHTLWESLHQDATKAVLITGEGDTTCSGADRDLLEGGVSDDAGGPGDLLHEVFHLIQTYSRPTVMACKGKVLGGGFGMAMECDLAVIGDETTFAYPETKIGVFSGRIPELLEHLVGASVAKEVTLVGDPIPPERAKALGLVFDVVPESEVDGVAANLVQSLAGYDAKAVELTKETLAFEPESTDYPLYLGEFEI
jgi:enoyl-CoA hydratase/carnithine racemase